MLSLVDNSNTNHDIRAEHHGLYKLSLTRNADIAVASKPVFGASITFHTDLLTYDSFIVKPDNLLGWVDMGGLVYFNICSGQHPLGMDNVKGNTATTLPSQFISAENGILRFTSALRIYLLAKTPRDIQEYGLCYFTPV
ncbi:hypothetical protein R1T43_09170 [Alteromonas sp. CI.11.F.A3]|uniref:hypothetical protein n=1 Tax=unclassified Alteromonas TaxID=2614992 RepID=UPI001B39E1A3|nr:MULTISPECIES: hypothetical protein [unclassified Alteromonas]MBQ4830478.1 hypothetical protein [Alteromonas sp. MMG017]WOI39176.1 hypothetical protein R1T43_09170 [Alteromonas sp. CI.11.F.A3]